MGFPYYFLNRKFKFLGDQPSSLNNLISTYRFERGQIFDILRCQSHSCFEECGVSP